MPNSTCSLAFERSSAHADDGHEQQQQRRDETNTRRCMEFKSTIHPPTPSGAANAELSFSLAGHRSRDRLSNARTTRLAARAREITVNPAGFRKERDVRRNRRDLPGRHASPIIRTEGSGRLLTQPVRPLLPSRSPRAALRIRWTCRVRSPSRRFRESRGRAPRSHSKTCASTSTGALHSKRSSRRADEPPIEEIGQLADVARGLRRVCLNAAAHDGHRCPSRGRTTGTRRC